MAAEIQFESVEELEAWLAKQPREVSITVAARAALRVLPVIQMAEGISDFRRALALPVFRATAISWAAVYPGQEMQFARVNAAAAHAAAAGAANATYATAARAAANAAATAADAASTAADTAHGDVIAAAAASRTADGANSAFNLVAPAHIADAFWPSLSTDAAHIELGEAAATLAAAPLWLVSPSSLRVFRIPDQLWSLWEDLKKALLDANEDWDVWANWYADRLGGNVRDEARELAYVRIGNDRWYQGPVAVNAEIKRRIGELESSIPLGPSGPLSPWELSNKKPPAPVPNVPSAISYGWTAQGTITITAGAQNQPVFPFAGGERDHANRLEACRTLAADMARMLQSGRYNARREYKETLEDYGRDLPSQPGEGNFILADAYARVLRQMFAAEASVLAPALAAKLKILLEQHIGLRAYYPAVAEFYDSVRTGHLERPLPLDAVQDFIQGIRDNTPEVFEPNVSETLAQTAEPVPEIPPPGPEAPPLEATQPVPPPDPLGEVDPEKSQRLTVASGINSLWDTALQGEKIAKNVEGWSKVIDALTPAVTTILDYLRQIIP